MVLKIYTDGACSGNPGPGGWAYVLVNKIPSNCKVNSGGKQETTNNEMELTALSNALKFTASEGMITVSINERPVELFSPSFKKQEIPDQVRNDKLKGSVEIKIRDTGIGISQDEGGKTVNV